MIIGIDTRQAALPPSGASIYARELISALIKADCPHSFQLYCLPFSPFAGMNGGRIRVIEAKPSESYSSWTQFTLPKLTAHNKPDILYTPICSFPILANLRGLPQANTIHDLCWKTAPDGYSFSRRLKHRFWVNTVLRRSRAVFADSLDTRDRCLEIYPQAKDRIYVVYPGIQPFFTAAQNNDSKQTDTFVFFCPGGASLPRKRFDEAARTIEILRNKTGKNILLVVSGKIHPKYQMLIDSTEWIQAQGIAPDKILVKLYNECDAVFFPSPREGYGFPVLEGLTLNKPVIASAGIPIVRELFSRNVIELPEDARPEVAAHMCTKFFTEYEECMKMTKEGQEKAKTVTWSKAAGQVLTVLGSLS